MEYQMEELLPIVSKLAQKYTGCESTSITYEKAQSLMEAVLFCLNEYDDSCANSLARRDIPAQERYDVGARILSEKVGNIRKIFDEISPSFEDFGIRCLHDAVQNGMPHFLKWYDVKFCPQDTILALDYQVLTDCSRLRGADAVYEYIRALEMEQRFLGAFDREFVITVLKTYHPGYRDTTENICSIVLANILSRMTAQQGKTPREKTPLGEAFLGEYAQWANALHGKSVSEMEDMAKGFLKKMACRFYEEDAALLAYLCQGARDIAARVCAADCLTPQSGYSESAPPSHTRPPARHPG